MQQVTAICADAETARRAVEALMEAPFPERDVSVLLLEHEGAEVTPIDVDQKTAVPQGIAVGSALGATAGLAAAATGFLPGLLAAGPALAALQAMIAGAGGGSLLGALGGLGWWTHEADIPVRELEKGAVLVGVSVPEERRDEAMHALRRAGVERIETAAFEPPDPARVEGG